MGTNVLALGPRHCLMVRGNPVTKAALERVGAAVVEYSGREISVKGAGGPTCLTRPITRT
jgi:arginine deiminase